MACMELESCKVSDGDIKACRIGEQEKVEANFLEGIR